jgi:hypothetical protein
MVQPTTPNTIFIKTISSVLLEGMYRSVLSCILTTRDEGDHRDHTCTVLCIIRICVNRHQIT